MNTNCNCNNNCDCCDPCNSGCCKPSKYDGCSFDIYADPYSTDTWVVNTGGKLHKIKIPKMAETCTTLSTEYSSATLNFKGECETQTITGAQLGELINLEDLRDTKITNPEHCSLFVYNPHCDDECAGCRKVGAKWENYSIPDATETIEQIDGSYNILVKNDCGCIEEAKLPVVPAGMAAISYQRDSIPDDPDWPWYYGCYNDTINLHLADNAPQYFNKYALKVTVHYGVQAIKSDKFNFNYNWRSLITPGIVGESRHTEKAASILQNWAIAVPGGDDKAIPWGTSSLRGSLTFVVPKGKEAYLHHEMRIRVAPEFMPAGSHWYDYYRGSWDGQQVPTSEAQLDSIEHPATRLNALEVIIEPTSGFTDYTPSADAPRAQLDAPVDDIENPYGA